MRALETCSYCTKSVPPCVTMHTLLQASKKRWHEHPPFALKPPCSCFSCPALHFIPPEGWPPSNPAVAPPSTEPPPVTTSIKLEAAAPPVGPQLTPVVQMQHLPSPHQLLEATNRERWRRGWAAVAPELEPYLDTQRWPSGHLLPDRFRVLVARRTRHPPWLPEHPWPYAMCLLLPGVAMQWLCIQLELNDTMRVSNGDWGPHPLTCANSITGHVEFACRPCIEMVAFLLSLVSLWLFAVLRVNRSVQLHVNCLYVLYALDNSDAYAPPDLMHSVRLPYPCTRQPELVCVYADGSFDMGPATGGDPDRQATADGRSSGTVERRQDTFICQRCQCHYQQADLDSDEASNCELTAGNKLSCNERKPASAAAGDGEKDCLLGDSAV